MLDWNERGAELRERVLSKVALAESGCWNWTGGIACNGYGRINIQEERLFSAHRASFYAFWHPIPEGASVLHHCDNRRCVNPQHLYAGTAKDNARDMVARGRWISPYTRKTKCPQGHEYDAVNSNGARICRRCSRAAQKRWAIKNKEK